MIAYSPARIYNNEVHEEMKKSTNAYRVLMPSSNTKMVGYPCVINNIELSGVLLKEFYFYLCVGANNPDIALLGNDFLRFCDFNKEKNSDIEITSIDLYSYV